MTDEEFKKEVQVLVECSTSSTSLRTMVEQSGLDEKSEHS